METRQGQTQRRGERQAGMQRPPAGPAACRSMLGAAALAAVSATGSAFASPQSPADLAAALRADAQAGNATAAHLSILTMTRDGTVPAALVVALEAGLDDDDEQMRQMAAVLLLGIYDSNAYRERAWPASLPVRAVEGLRSDSVAFNAIGIWGALFRLVFEDVDRLPPEVTSELTAALGSPDLQQRQMAAALLVAAFEAQRRGSAEWPADLIDVLVEGLRDDDIRGGRQLGNLAVSFRALHGLADQQPVNALEGLVAGDDAQARWAAVLILASYRADSVQPAISEELYANLADDRRLFNEVAAFKSLRRLGADNLRALLEQIDSGAVGRPDAQQAAFIQCLAAWFGHDWLPDEDAFRSWRRWAAAGQRIGTAALFLTPDRRALLEGVEVPDPLARMIRLGPRTNDSRDNSRWAAGWIWWLDDTDDDWLAGYGFWAAY